VAGLVGGFLMSIPVGPVNITVINEALNRGFLRPFLIGVGAVTAEAIYCLLALTGFQTVIDLPYVRSTTVLISFLVVTLLGFRYLMARAEFADRTSLLVEYELEEKLHLHRGYLVGLGMTLGNPFILLVWGTLAAFLYEHDLVRSGVLNVLAFAGGMAGGGTLWFFLLAQLTSRKHRNISPRALRILTRVSGAGLLAVGALLGAKLVQAMAGAELLKHFR
jgi:L-lysine exporter family protein LysE/ArgO